MNVVLACLLAPALAGSDAPEFLLGDLGVRVDLPGGWRMTRWSDWDFAGASADGSVLVFAWATPVQVPITAAEPWEPVFSAKVLEMSGKDPTRAAASVQEIGGRKVAFVDESFRFADGNKGTMYAATIEIAGKDFHLATVSSDRAAAAGRRARQDLVARLEFAAPPPPSTFGASVAAKGVTTTLPADWRPSLDAEWSSLQKPLVDLGLEDVTDCWVAVRPKPAAPPDEMVTCLRKGSFGVVDLYSAKRVDLALREKLFGKNVPEGVPVELSDRIGFLWAPRDGLAFGAVPTAEGVAVTWAIGDGDLGASVRAAMAGSTYTGPHPVELGDRVSYWLGVRTFSAQVLCPSLCCVAGAILLVAGAVGGGAAMARRKGGPDDGEDGQMPEEAT